MRAVSNVAAILFLVLTSLGTLRAQGAPVAPGLSWRADARDPAVPGSLGGPVQSGGWARLQQIGPDRNAVVTLTTGIIRGGRIRAVLPDTLQLESAALLVALARSEIATVRVKRPRGTLAGGLLGFAVSGALLTAIVCTGGNGCGVEGVVLGFTVLGVPGGLLGALVGSQVGGDVELVP